MVNWGDIGLTIRELVRTINVMFSFLVDKLRDSTFFTQFVESTESSTFIDTIQSTALVLCTMFFFIDFFTKTLHLQWVTWENVLMLILKLVVAKVCVENAVWITTVIYDGFTGIVDAIDPITQNTLIPTTSTSKDGTWMAAYRYFVTQSDATRIYNEEGAGFLDFKPLLVSLMVQIQGLIMQIVMILANVVVLGRMFELVVYTMIAPIPLSTLACEGLQDVGKSFLKSYAAVCVQAIVLLLMFLAYTQLSGVLFMFENNVAGSLDGWMGLLMTLTLGLGVMQSGSWAKRICNAM